MSASSLLKALDTDNEAEKCMNFEEWVEQNLEPGAELHWDSSDAKRIWSSFDNDAVRMDCTEAFANAFKKINGTMTCGAVATVISTSDNETVKQSMVEYLAPLVRDPQNKQTILDAFHNRGALPHSF